MKGFWEKVDRSDSCWGWRGAVNSRGYGVFYLLGYTVKVHRFAYQITYGAIPDGLFVCHRCDNPVCVRPDHLFLGTGFDNMGDASEKGRMPGYSMPGETNPQAVLTTDQVKEIRSTYATGGTSQRALARQFGVSQTHIGEIIRRERWKSVA